MKYYRMSYEEVVFKRSYVNILLLNRSIPSFNTKDKGDVALDEEWVGKEVYKNEGDLFMSFM